jgi:hypothetical protein
VPFRKSKPRVPHRSPSDSSCCKRNALVNEIESFLGRASVKLGTSLPLAGGQIVAYPFLTASVFHEFEGNVTASVTTAGAFVFRGPFQFQSSGNITARLLQRLQELNRVLGIEFESACSSLSSDRHRGFCGGRPEGRPLIVVENYSLQPLSSVRECLGICFFVSELRRLHGWIVLNLLGQV